MVSSESGYRTGSRSWEVVSRQNSIFLSLRQRITVVTCLDGSLAEHRMLRNEGRPEEQLYLVGNVMIDTLKLLLPKARERDTRHLETEGAVAPFDRITRLFGGIVWLLSC